MREQTLHGIAAINKMNYVLLPNNMHSVVTVEGRRYTIVHFAPTTIIVCHMSLSWIEPASACFKQCRALAPFQRAINLQGCTCWQGVGYSEEALPFRFLQCTGLTKPERFVSEDHTMCMRLALDHCEAHKQHFWICYHGAVVNHQLL